MKTILHTRLQGNDYPKLQVNRKGEIVLAFSKKSTLTRGVLVGFTEDIKPEDKQFEIGKIFDDWEVVGELFDYEEEVHMYLTIQNN